MKKTDPDPYILEQNSVASKGLKIRGEAMTEANRKAAAPIK
jgi:hypothetical protein